MKKYDPLYHIRTVLNLETTSIATVKRNVLLEVRNEMLKQSFRKFIRKNFTDYLTENAPDESPDVINQIIESITTESQLLIENKNFCEITSDKFNWENVFLPINNDENAECIVVDGRYSGTDMKDGKIKEVRAKSPQHCQELCKLNKECQFFIYFSTSHYQRYKHKVCRFLRFSGEMELNQNGHVSGPQICPEEFIPKIKDYFISGLNRIISSSCRIDEEIETVRNNLVGTQGVLLKEGRIFINDENELQDTKQMPIMKI